MRLCEAVTMAIKGDYPGYKITLDYDHENVSSNNDEIRKPISRSVLRYIDKKRFLDYIKKNLVKTKKVSKTKKQVHCIVRPGPGIFG